MLIRKGLFALAAATVVGLAARDASAAVIHLTVDGCKDGENIHTTVSFDCKSGLLSLKGKGGVQLCGGVIFAAPPCNPDFNAPGDIIPHDKPTDCHNNDNPDGPPPNLDITSDQTEHCVPQWHDDCHDPCVTITGPSGIPTLDVITDGPATPLPAGMWGAGALMGSLGIVRRIRRRRA